MCGEGVYYVVKVWSSGSWGLILGLESCEGKRLVMY